MVSINATLGIAFSHLAHTNTHASARRCPYEFMIVHFQATGHSGDRWKRRILFTNSFLVESWALPRGCFSAVAFFTRSKFRPQVINGVLMQETFKVAQADDLVPRPWIVRDKLLFF